MSERNCSNCFHGDVCKKCSPLFAMCGCKDFFELVRCKDCQHLRVSNKLNRHCCMSGQPTYDAGYCSWGERKDNG